MLKFTDALNKINISHMQDIPRYIKLPMVNFLDYLELEVVENHEPEFILLKAKGEDKIIRLGLDKMLIKAQYGYDRHFMTTVGAKLVIRSERHWMHKNMWVWRLHRLSFGLEVWDNGFKY